MFTQTFRCCPLAFVTPTTFINSHLSAREIQKWLTTQWSNNDIIPPGVILTALPTAAAFTYHTIKSVKRSTAFIAIILRQIFFVIRHHGCAHQCTIQSKIWPENPFPSITEGIFWGLPDQFGVLTFFPQKWSQVIIKGCVPRLTYCSKAAQK